MMKRIFNTAVLFLCMYGASAQVSAVKPEKPSNGDIISLTYDYSTPQARLHGEEAIYARITLYKEDGSIGKFHVKMLDSAGILVLHFSPPAGTSSFKTEFYTLNKDDEKASHLTMIYDTNHQIPVRSAYLEALFGAQPDSAFLNEVANYPDNYLAYARFINIVSMVKEPHKAKGQIDGLLKTLDDKKFRDLAPSPGMLTALCVGYAKSGNMEVAKKHLLELFENFPQAAETAFAFSIYHYEHYKSNGRYGLNDDVQEKLKDLFTEYPSAPVSMDPNVFQILRSDPRISTDTFEQVLRPLYLNETIPSYALSSLPEIYIERNTKLDSAETMLNRAIQKFQYGTIHHQYRLNYSNYQLYLPLLYYNLAKLHSMKQNYPTALTCSTAGLSFLAAGSAEGNFLPLFLALRAELYKKIGNLNLALEDYSKLFKAGNTAVTDSMALIFPRCDRKEKTFSSFLTSLKPSGNGVSKALPAPDFTAIDLKGNSVSLSHLKGKVVVLNLWGIGCGPCIAEMPKLNQLVREYQGRNEVVFLGITSDQTDALIRFSQNRRFDYRVLNSAGNVGEKFGTNVLPVHIVIDKNGNVIHQSVGASLDIQDRLREVIESQL